MKSQGVTYFLETCDIAPTRNHKHISTLFGVEMLFLMCKQKLQWNLGRNAISIAKFQACTITVMTSFPGDISHPTALGTLKAFVVFTPVISSAPHLSSCEQIHPFFFSFHTFITSERNF